MGAQEGRRKKQRMGTDHDVDLAVAAGTVYTIWATITPLDIRLRS